MPAALAIRDYLLDLDDPRAPTEEQWARMSADERQRVIATLPSDLPEATFVPEGDAHRRVKIGALDALERQFRRIGRRIYLSSELGVFYPGEPRFAPDVLAVLDVEPGERSSWVVAKEGKGLDFVLEVHVSGDLRKDREANVARYARLGISEYFVFDRSRLRLSGHRLGPEGARVYRPIMPQAGRYPSLVLGLELAVERQGLRFFYGDAVLPEADEIIAKLGSMTDGLIAAREEAERQKEEAERRADDLARQLAEALSENERLKKH